MLLKWLAKGRKVVIVLVLASNAAPLQANDLEKRTLTPAQLAQTRQLLESRAAGKVTDKEFFAAKAAEFIIPYYFTGTNPIPTKTKNCVAAILQDESLFSESIPLIQDYLREVPKDREGWAMLGRALVMTKSYGSAVPALSKSIELVDTSNRKAAFYQKGFCYSLLARASVGGCRPEVLDSVITNLANIKWGEVPTEDMYWDTHVAVLCHAVSTRDEELFIRVLDPAQLGISLRHEGARSIVGLGAYVFESKKLDPIRAALRSTRGASNPPPPMFEIVPIKQGEIERVRELLDENEKGNPSVSLYDNINPELGNQLVGYYLLGTNSIPSHGKLVISRALGMAGRLTEALKLARDYSQEFPKDGRGWRLLGMCHYFVGEHESSCWALSKAEALGASDVEQALIVTSILSGHLNAGKPAIPKLVEQLRSTETPQSTKTEIRNNLMLYAIATKDRDLFINTANALEIREIIDFKNLPGSLSIGYRFFQAKELDPLWRSYRAATN